MSMYNGASSGMDQVTPNSSVRSCHVRPSRWPSDDLALEVRRGSGVDVPRVDAQPLEHRLAGPRQLLHGVHDRDVVLDAQVPDQGLVGDAVDARLVAARVDRHAVRLLVVQRLEQSLARGHGLFSGCHDLLSLSARSL